MIVCVRTNWWLPDSQQFFRACAHAVYIAADDLSETSISRVRFGSTTSRLWCVRHHSMFQKTETSAHLLIFCWTLEGPRVESSRIVSKRARIALAVNASWCVHTMGDSKAVWLLISYLHSWGIELSSILEASPRYCQSETSSFANE